MVIYITIKHSFGKEFLSHALFNRTWLEKEEPEKQP